LLFFPDKTWEVEKIRTRMVTSRKKVSLVMVLVMVLLDILHSLEHIPLKVIHLKVIHLKGIPHRATLPLGTLPVHTHHLVILLAHQLPTNQVSCSFPQSLQ
jgi:uncharacterized protein (UPF0548 family)